MEIFTLARLQSDGVGTKSRIAGAAFLCFALELAFHDPKIPGKTRIPAGTYGLHFHGASKFDKVYRKRVEGSGQIYRGMIEIGGVPDFSGVLFHCGNTTADSEGCVMCGNAVVAAPGGYIIPGGESTPAFLRVYAAVSAAIAAGGAQLVVTDTDR